MSDNTSVRVKIWGRVQGVGFRFFVIASAEQFALKGWVKNLPDGTVETVAAGPKKDLVSWIDKLRIGPPLAHVDRLDADWSEPLQKYTTFSIKQ